MNLFQKLFQKLIRCISLKCVRLLHQVIEFTQHFLTLFEECKGTCDFITIVVQPQLLSPFQALTALLADDNKFGFIVMDGNGALFGTLSGNTREVLHKFTVDLPKKHGKLSVAVTWNFIIGVHS